jgi:hypothetical protein
MSIVGPPCSEAKSAPFEAGSEVVACAFRSFEVATPRGSSYAGAEQASASAATLPAPIVLIPKILRPRARSAVSELVVPSATRMSCDLFVIRIGATSR